MIVDSLYFFLGQGNIFIQQFPSFIAVAAHITVKACPGQDVDSLVIDTQHYIIAAGF
jgi:hypothetical protein